MSTLALSAGQDGDDKMTTVTYMTNQHIAKQALPGYRARLAVIATAMFYPTVPSVSRVFQGCDKQDKLDNFDKGLTLRHASRTSPTDTVRVGGGGLGRLLATGRGTGARLVDDDVRFGFGESVGCAWVRA